MRSANTYRGARRNLCKHEGRVWGQSFDYYSGFEPTRRRASFISKPASKYMPHDGGKGYFKNDTLMFNLKPVSSFLGMTFTQIAHAMRNLRKGR